jgi:NADPH:quinone reductase
MPGLLDRRRPYRVTRAERGGTASRCSASRPAVHTLPHRADIVLYGNRGGSTSDIGLRDFYLAGAYNARVIGFVSTVPAETKGEDLAILARLIADGRLVPRIGWTGDWTQTAEAFAAMARREFRGKAVLLVPAG